MWTKVSGPTAGVLTNGTKSIATLSGLTAGIYKYSLKVIDSRASWALDTMTITVNATPLAKAGLDGIITLPTNSFTLRGNLSSDPDGSITSFAWTKIGGPASYLIVSPTSSITSVKNLVAGIYTFRLTVKDNRGGIAYDDVKVTVSTATTAAPSAVKEEEAISATSSLKLIPTLVKNSLQVQISSEATGSTSIRVHDMNGKQLKAVQMYKDVPTIQTIIQTSELTPGMYQVEVRIGKGERMVQRFVKE